MMDGPRLTALVASRLCHDIFNPLNAIIQGLEMIKSDPAARDSDGVGVVDHGVTTARAKLEMFRHVFSSPSNDDVVDLSEAQAPATAYYGPVKSNLDWALNGVQATRTGSRIVLHLLMIANECLPRGGTVRAEAAPAGERGEIRIIAKGPRAGVRAATAAGLRGEAPEEGFQGHNIQPYLAGLIARGADVELVMREAPETVELIARGACYSV